MTKSDTELLNELVAVFSTVIAEMCRSISRQATPRINRRIVSQDIERASKKLPLGLKYEKQVKTIITNICAQLDDKPFVPVTFLADKSSPRPLKKKSSSRS